MTAPEFGDGEARAERLATSLIDRLVREGVILDHRWRDALHAQPRHHFVDAFHEPGERDGSWRETATDAATFLPTVHSGRTVVTALSPLDPWGRQVPVAIAPPVDLLITALQALDLFDGADVLELGTGTGPGHTTALLSERVGDGHVTSVGIDPDLHRTAARHLHARDLHPTLLVGDSASPPARTEYDRVIVEHEVPTVPPSWVALVRPGGSLLVRVTGGLGAGGHALLRRPDVRWAGNIRLLSAVEHAHDLWHRLGTPALTAFGITAGTDGARVWHDSADTGTWWPLRAA